ncbi:MAG: LuxR C-terminal-related transcriptional regulator [Ktedonobacteraceae bacterium]
MRDQQADDGRDGQEIYRHIFMRLITLGQASYRNMQEATDRLSQEILALTDRRASFTLSPQTPTYEGEKAPYALSLPVCFRDKWYGRLQIAGLDGQPTLPAFPRSVAYPLAEMCGWLLFICEITVFLEQFRDRFDLAACQPLTKREEQALALMGQRLSDLKIAQALFITVTTVHTYQRNIYHKLGVHGKQEAILVGWLLGLFAPLAGA